MFDFLHLIYGGTGMRKWSMIMKKMTVLLLSAMLISAMMPGQARAQEQSEQDDTKISVQSGDTDSGSEFETEEDTDSPQADDAAGSDNAIQTTDVQDTGAEKETSGTDDKSDPSDDDQNDGQQSEDAKENGQQNEDAKEDGQQTGSGQEGTWPGGIPEITRDPMAFPILMDSSNELYSSLSQFLSLSSDQFQIYTVAVIDPVTQQPVQPDSPVEVSLDMPSGYDTDRVVVSEISMDGVGRCLDNIRVERTWKTVKYGFVFLYEWSSRGQLEKGLDGFIKAFNKERPHEALGYQTPDEVYERGCFPVEGTDTVEVA